MGTTSTYSAGGLDELRSSVSGRDWSAGRRRLRRGKSSDASTTG